MQKTIEMLFEGRLNYYEFVPPSPRSRKLLDNVIDTEEKLEALFNEEQKTLFQEFIQRREELNVTEIDDALFFGFRTGMRLAAECFSGELIPDENTDRE